MINCRAGILRVNTEERGMKLTSAEANKMIRALKDQYRLLFSQEENVVSFIAATTENVEEVRPPYSYEETAAKYDEIERKIRKIKHALNVFNATTKVEGFDMTIDEMLVFLPQATDRPPAEAVRHAGKAGKVPGGEYRQDEYHRVRVFELRSGKGSAGL